MADVYAVTFTLIGLLLTLPALLVAINLMLPQVTTTAASRLEKTPYKSFFVGLPIVTIVIVWIALTSAANFGPLQFTAFMAAIMGMGLGTIGAAGMARLFGRKLRPLASPNSELTNLVRGAVVYELACLFPFVGWFLFAPLVGVMVIGAAAFGIVRWAPRPAARPATSAPPAIAPPVLDQA